MEETQGCAFVHEVSYVICARLRESQFLILRAGSKRPEQILERMSVVELRERKMLFESEAISWLICAVWKALFLHKFASLHAMSVLWTS